MLSKRLSFFLEGKKTKKKLVRTRRKDIALMNTVKTRRRKRRRRKRRRRRKTKRKRMSKWEEVEVEGKKTEE
jgi:predicted alpha/beta superfamily hydrolase